MSQRASILVTLILRKKFVFFLSLYHLMTMKRPSVCCTVHSLLDYLLVYLLIRL